MAAVNPEPQWAIVELMGHVRMAGRVSEEQRFGVTLGRMDVPDVAAGAAPDAVARTQLFSGSSIYRVTYCTEDAARAVVAEQAKWVQPTTHHQALPARRDEDRASEPCEDCGQSVDTDPTIAGAVLCEECAEDRERARDVDLHEQAKADDAEVDAASGIEAALDGGEETSW